MRILLDTSYLYDLMETHGKFSDRERRFFTEQEIEIYVSAVSIWEMRLKYRAHHRSGERKSPFDPMNGGRAGHDDPTHDHEARCKLETPIPHRDPFDELLLVQAQEEGLKLLTADRQLVEHPLTITV